MRKRDVAVVVFTVVLQSVALLINVAFAVAGKHTALSMVMAVLLLCSLMYTAMTVARGDWR